MDNFDENNTIWQNDSEVNKCTVCSVKFSIFYRRHHCRKCGLIICNKCSNFTTNYNRYEKLRICTKCTETIDLKKILVNTSTQTQTNYPKTSNIAIQTKVFEKKNSVTQTDIIEKRHSETQTNTNNKSNISTQIDYPEKIEPNCQTEYMFDYENNSESESEFYENIETDEDIKNPANTEIYFEEKVKDNMSTKEYVLKRKLDKKIEEERKYLIEFNKTQNQYKNKIKHLRKGEFFEVSN